MGETSTCISRSSCCAPPSRHRPTLLRTVRYDAPYRTFVAVPSIPTYVVWDPYPLPPSTAPLPNPAARSTDAAPPGSPHPVMRPHAPEHWLLLKSAQHVARVRQRCGAKGQFRHSQYVPSGLKAIVDNSLTQRVSFIQRHFCVGPKRGPLPSRARGTQC